jgi:hypothetical protein
MLSLKYYGVVHRADTEDYMQSLRSEEELDKNDFRHLMYAVRAKSTDEGPSLPEIRRTADAISEFDDDEEVQDQRATQSQRQKVSNVETSIEDPTVLPVQLRTVDVSSQLFLTSKRSRVEQQGFTPHAAGGFFGRPEQKRLRQQEPDIDSETEGVWVDGNPEINTKESPWSHGSQSPELDAAVAEKRWKGKEQVVGEYSRPDSRLSNSALLENPKGDVAPIDSTKSKDLSALDPILLFDEDEPVPDPENDKFNLANQIPRKELLQTMDQQNITGDTSERTEEQQDRDIVRVKFESYWEQKEEKCRKKAEAEVLQRQEMDALKESVKRAQEVGEGTAQKVDSMSTSIAGLAQSVQESIAENNRTMMLQFSQMLHGIGFAPGLQSPYSQGEYPLALGFKSPANAVPKHLPAPSPAVIPPPTLAGVPAPSFARTEQTSAHPAETSNTSSEESAPTRAQGGGTAEHFAGPKQNDASDASQTVLDRPSPRRDSLLSDPTNATLQRCNVWEELETIPATMPEEVPALQKSTALSDDNNSTSIFTTVHRTGASHETTPSVPSSKAGEQAGDGGQSETGAPEGDNLEDEPVDYEPSPLREKNENKSHQQDDDVYSLSRLSPPRPSLHKV